MISCHHGDDDNNKAQQHKDKDKDKKKQESRWMITLNMMVDHCHHHRHQKRTKVLQVTIMATMKITTIITRMKMIPSTTTTTTTMCRCNHDDEIEWRHQFCVQTQHSEMIPPSDHPIWKVVVGCSWNHAKRATKMTKVDRWLDSVGAIRMTASNSCSFITTVGLLDGMNGSEVIRSGFGPSEHGRDIRLCHRPCRHRRNQFFTILQSQISPRAEMRKIELPFCPNWLVHSTTSTNCWGVPLVSDETIFNQYHLPDVRIICHGLIAVLLQQQHRHHRRIRHHHHHQTIRRQQQQPKQRQQWTAQG
mmetsp:Transcript_3459/g.9875  ORF Transcript_3459/g.9875 Transcript_3459/m.9875 type:complete len:304 (+) Transcript_3459:1768-2679(+)